MLCVPALSDDVENVATPADRVPVPRMVEASLNVTVPVAPLVTVAVKVTAAPELLGLAELTRVVDVPALLMVCVTAVLVLVSKLVSPP